MQTDYQNSPLSSGFGEEASFPEETLQLLRMQSSWMRLDLPAFLPLIAGGTVEILSPGVWNHGAEPDFLNARIRFSSSGETRIGDVALRPGTSDWIRIAYAAKEPVYKNVVLRVVENDDFPEILQKSLRDSFALRGIPVCLLPRGKAPSFHPGISSSAPGKTFSVAAAAATSPDAFFSSPVSSGGAEERKRKKKKRKLLPVAEPAQRRSSASRGACAPFFGSLPAEALVHFLENAGLERMRRKSERILLEMLRSGSGNAFLGAFLSFLGSGGRNRENFRMLQHRLQAYPPECLETHFEALLWGESGLLPDPSLTPLPEDAEKIVKKLWLHWWRLRREASSPLPWVNDSRPLNSLERRIAMTAAFFRRFPGRNPLPHFAVLLGADPSSLSGDEEKPEKEKKNPAEEKRKEKTPSCSLFLNSLRLNDAFWNVHTSFRSGAMKRPAALLGNARSLEIAANVILPALRASAMIRHEKELLELSEACFLSLPALEMNRTLRDMRSCCFSSQRGIFPSAASMQGAIHLCRTYCEAAAFDCSICRFRRSLLL